MCGKRNNPWLLAVLGVLGCLCFLQDAGASPSATENSVDAIGTWLYGNQDQVGGSLSEGSWPPEGEYTGSIVIGLVEAYHRRCGEAYKEAALLGGEYIRERDSYPPLVYLGYGDDALAFAKLSSISPDPQDNQWRTELEDFYQYIRESIHGDGYQSTAGFISYYYSETEPSTAVFYLAHHAIAAYYVDAADKAIWRDSVRAFLAQVSDDTADFPVWALGVATWALAQTGPLDDTPVKTLGLGEPYWVGRTFADLPDLLLSHQKGSGPYEGSFFWRFDHTDGAGASGPQDRTHGFTEDNVFGVLGLAAALKANPDLPNVAAGISATKSLLSLGIDTDGSVWGHLWLASPKYFVYGGRMLTGFSGINVDGDMNMDDSVGPDDLVIFAQYWLDSSLCKCDFNEDGIINQVDFAMGPAKNWLWGTP